jgi:hypothetical protein
LRDMFVAAGSGVISAVALRKYDQATRSRSASSIAGNVRVVIRVSGGFDSSGVGTPTVITKPAAAISAATWVPTWGGPIAIARVRWARKKFPKAPKKWVETIAPKQSPKRLAE